jgi:hypothetical protein
VDRLLKAIGLLEKFYEENVEVAKLELSYVAGQNGTRSLLSNIKESRLGSDNLWSTIPETKFEYEKGVDFSPSSSFKTISNGMARIDQNGDSIPEDVSTTDGAPSGTSWSFLDFDGNYFVDKYVYIKGGPCYCVTPTTDTGVVKRNDGGLFVNLTAASIPGLSYSATYNLYQQPLMSELNIADVNADGLEDIFDTNLKLNIGGSFVNASFTVPTSILATGDFNGDGLIDVIKEYASSTASSTNGNYVYLNNGNGWNTLPESNTKVPYVKTMKGYVNTMDVDAGYRFVDVNNDGLLDLARSYISTQSYTVNNSGYIVPSGSAKELYINTGNGFVQVSNPNIPDYFVNYSLTYSGQTQTENKILDQIWENFILIFYLYLSDNINTSSVNDFL